MMLGNLINQLYNKHKKRYSDLTEIPFSEISSEPPKFFEWYCYEISEKIGAAVYADYSQSIVKIYKQSENITVKLDITFEIPYNNRDDYIDFIYEINNTVTSDGLCNLFVNNNPYQLCSYLCVQDTMASQNTVNIIAEKYGVKRCNDKGLNEFYNDMKYRAFNSVSFMVKQTKAEITDIVSNMFYFASKKKLEENGYYDKQSKRKKIFISYCHMDKSKVYEIIDALSDSGVDIWIDKKDIDVGDNILSSIMSGIEECDFSILFISKATVNSNFAKLELENIMSRMVMKNIKWYIVKLDDVEVNAIFPCLNNYKYYDFYTNQSINDLLENIIQTIKKSTAT